MKRAKVEGTPEARAIARALAERVRSKWTQAQWDGIFLYFVGREMPPALKAERAALQACSAYRWAEALTVERRREMAGLSDAELEKRAQLPTRMSEADYRSSLAALFFEGWQRQIPSITCPLEKTEQWEYRWRIPASAQQPTA